MTHKLDLPEQVDLGDFTNGSTHILDVATLRMPGPGRAEIGEMKIDAFPSESMNILESPISGSFSIPSKEHQYFEGSQEVVLRVKFAPIGSLPHKALLEIPIVWGDGTRTKQFVTITAKSHGIGDHRNLGPLPDDPTAVGRPVPELNYTGDNDADFAMVTDSCRDVAGGVADDQRRGVEQASRSARGFVPPEEHDLLFEALGTFAEIAITMASAGIAGIFAKKMSSALAKTIQGESKTLKASDLPEVIAVNDAVKEGLKYYPKKVATGSNNKVKALGAVDKAPAVKAGFFDHAQTILQQRIQEHKTLLTNQKGALIPLFKHHPHMAIFAAKALHESLNAGQAQALHEQKLTAESQWVTAVANASGSASSKLESIRNEKTHPSPGPIQIDGILRIRVNVDEKSSLKVESAALDGISKLAVADLAREPLYSVPMPLLVKVSSPTGDATITRDEKRNGARYRSAPRPTHDGTGS